MTKDEIKVARESFKRIAYQNPAYIQTKNIGIVNKAFDRLEELEALQEQLDERWNNCIGEQKTRTEQAENALDKACEKIAELCRENEECSEKYCPLKDGESCDQDCDYAGRWKDWALGYGKHR